MPQAFQSNGYGYFPTIIINPWPRIDTPFNPFAILVKSLIARTAVQCQIRLGNGQQQLAVIFTHHYQTGSVRLLQQTICRKRPGSFKQYVRSDIIRQRMDNMGVTILLENSISGVLCKCFQGSRIGMRQYGIFIRSTCRSLSMLQCQGDPITRGGLRTPLAYCDLREIPFIFRIRHRVLGKVIPHPVRIDISLSAAFAGIPILTGFRSYGCQLKNGCLRRKFRIRIFNVCAQTYYHVAKEVKRLAGPMRTVVLVMFMQLHAEVAIQTRL